MRPPIYTYDKSTELENRLSECRFLKSKTFAIIPVQSLKWNVERTRTLLMHKLMYKRLLN